MKFKYLVIVFAVIIVLALFFAVLLSLISQPLNGPDTQIDFTLNLRFLTLPLIAFTILLLASIGIYFFYNYRLFFLLEREDWPALAYYLEQKIYVKGNYSTRYVRILASSYLVISDFASVLVLEDKAAKIKPSVIEKNVLIFGSARILSGNHKGAAAFFKTYIEKDKGNQRKNDERQWLKWFHGFSYLLAGDFKEAQSEFVPLAEFSSEVIITCVSAFFLNSTISKNSETAVECLAAAEKGRSRVLKTIKTAEAWKNEVDKAGSEIHIAIIRKYIDEAGTWIFTPPEQE